MDSARVQAVLWLTPQRAEFIKKTSLRKMNRIVMSSIKDKALIVKTDRGSAIPFWALYRSHIKLLGKARFDVFPRGKPTAEIKVGNVQLRLTLAQLNIFRLLFSCGLGDRLMSGEVHEAGEPEQGVVHF